MLTRHPPDFNHQILFRTFPPTRRISGISPMHIRRNGKVGTITIQAPEMSRGRHTLPGDGFKPYACYSLPGYPGT